MNKVFKSSNRALSLLVQPREEENKEFSDSWRVAIFLFLVRNFCLKNLVPLDAYYGESFHRKKFLLENSGHRTDKESKEPVRLGKFMCEGLIFLSEQR